jgi:hypothetical protein
MVHDALGVQLVQRVGNRGPDARDLLGRHPPGGAPVEARPGNPLLNDVGDAANVARGNEAGHVAALQAGRIIASVSNASSSSAESAAPMRGTFSSEGNGAPLSTS